MLCAAGCTLDVFQLTAPTCLTSFKTLDSAEHNYRNCFYAMVTRGPPAGSLSCGQAATVDEPT